MELTILMPCLNEARTVGKCVGDALGYLALHGLQGEVVVADNGSTDGSRELAVSAGARVVPVKERGYGAALMGGIREAKGTYIVMGDADDSYDFRNLGPFVQALRGGSDLVMGNRFRGGIASGAMPALHRYLGNPVLSALGRLFFRLPVGDFHCGLRGFNRASIQNLASSAVARHGVRHRDGGQVCAGRVASDRGAHYAATRWPRQAAAPSHMARWLAAPQIHDAV